jgi:hypothetical protein
LCGAVTAEVVLGLAAPASAVTSSAGEQPPVSTWFDHAELSLRWHVSGPKAYPSGTLAGKPLEFALVPSLTKQGMKVYTFTGRFGGDSMGCTVDFGPDGDSFHASGHVGAARLALDCAARPLGTKKWPVTGTIGGQPFALTVNTTGHGPVLVASVGDADLAFKLTDVHSGPDAGEAAGSLGRGTLTVLGTVRRPHPSPVGETKLVYVLQGYGNDSPPLITLSGYVTGPSTALIAGLAFFYGSALQD